MTKWKRAVVGLAVLGVGIGITSVNPAGADTTGNGYDGPGYTQITNTCEIDNADFTANQWQFDYIVSTEVAEVNADQATDNVSDAESIWSWAESSLVVACYGFGGQTTPQYVPTPIDTPPFFTQPLDDTLNVAFLLPEWGGCPPAPARCQG